MTSECKQSVLAGEAVPGALPDAKRFYRVFLITSLGIALGYLAIHVLVDPYENFGTGWVEPLTSSVRREKTRLLAGVADQPEVLVLGSSRVMKFEPAYLQDRLGVPAFNLGVSSAMAEDYYVLLRYALSIGVPVKTILLGVDDEAFHDTRPIDSRLLKNGHLAEFLDSPERLSSLSSSLQQALSYQGLRDTADCLRLNVKGFPPRRSTFASSDGALTYETWDSQIANGNFDLEANLKGNVGRYRDRYEGFTGISDWRMAYFERFLSLCQREGIVVYCFVTPLHPILERQLIEGTSLTARRREVVAYLGDSCKRHQMHFLDTSDLATFHGDADEYYDGVHPRIANTRKIIDTVLQTAGEASNAL